MYILVLFLVSYSCLTMFSFSSLNIVKTVVLNLSSKSEFLMEIYFVPLTVSLFLCMFCDLLLRLGHWKISHCSQSFQTNFVQRNNSTMQSVSESHGSLKSVLVMHHPSAGARVFIPILCMAAINV